MEKILATALIPYTLALAALILPVWGIKQIRKYFLANVVIALVCLIFIQGLLRKGVSNDLFQNLIHSHFIKALILELTRKQQYAYLVIGLALVTYLLEFIFFRKIKPLYEEWRFKHKKQVRNAAGNDQRNMELERVEYNFHKYFDRVENVPECKYFIGLDIKAVKDQANQIYLEQSKLTQHVQIVGPTGFGKTKSAIIPLAYQTLTYLCPVLMVDGKADQELIKQFNGRVKEYNDYYGQQYPKMQFKCFNLVKQKNQRLMEISHSYNPLSYTRDPGRLTTIIFNALAKNATGESKYYEDFERLYLFRTLELFAFTGQAYSFKDIIAFMMNAQAREYVYNLVRNNDFGGKVSIFISEYYADDDRAKMTKRHISGISNSIFFAFCADEEISELINTYNSDINIYELFQRGWMSIFSIPVATNTDIHIPIARLVVASLEDLIATKTAQYQELLFWMIILEEFGVYASDTAISILSLARSSNNSLVLSYQDDSMLDRFYPGLSANVNQNCAVKYYFSNMENAEEICKKFGTIPSQKRTDVLEEAAFLTENRTGAASYREADTWNINPNELRSLQPGQSLFKYVPPEKEKTAFGAKLLNHAMVQFDCLEPFVPEHTAAKNEGLNLFRFIEDQKITELIKDIAKEKAVTNKKRETTTSEKTAQETKQIVNKESQAAASKIEKTIVKAEIDVKVKEEATTTPVGYFE